MSGYGKAAPQTVRVGGHVYAVNITKSEMEARNIDRERARQLRYIPVYEKKIVTITFLAAKHLEGAALCRTAALKWKPRKKLRVRQSFRSVGNASVTSQSDINEE
jgi:hypothetical protein